MNTRTKVAAAVAALSLAAIAGASIAADGLAAPFDPHDLTGVWLQKGPAPFRDYAWTAPYQKIVDARKAAEAAGNPYQPAGASCLPRGLVGMVTTGAYPIEIFQRAAEVVLNKENGGVWRIYLNRQHLKPDDLTPLFFGDTVGHWDGDTLVTDSISLGATDNIDGQSPHSDALHVVTRIHRTGPDTLDVEVAIDDAKALAKPAHTLAHFVRQPTYEMQEYFCVNDRNTFGADGKQHVAGVK